jgi:hypothetical protein
MMDLEDLIELASPSCWECGQPIVRTEMPHRQDDAGEWHPVATMVCSGGHRMLITP